MQSKELTLVGYDHTWELVIHQQTLRMSMRAARIAEEIGLLPRVEDLAEQFLREFFYPVMASVTTCQAGPIPTVDEFLDLPKLAANSWYTAVLELNPEALPKELGGVLEELSEEKKEN